MPAYHSAYNNVEVRQVGNISCLPLKVSPGVRGPAFPPEDPNMPDVVDEAILLFRVNSLFRNFEIKGGADRALIYLILWISECLGRIAAPSSKSWTVNEAKKQLTSAAVDNFALPGEPGFPLNNLYAPPASKLDGDFLRQWLLQARQETALRLIDRVYGPDGKPSKWWMAFTKRKFMGKSL